MNLLLEEIGKKDEEIEELQKKVSESEAEYQNYEAIID